MIRLWCRFRSTGTQWPLRPGDEIEVRDENGMDVMGVLAAELLIDLIAHYLYGAKLQQIMAQMVPPEGIRKPLTKSDVAPAALQESRRKKRRGLVCLAVVVLSGCQPEDVGVRLRRECESIVRAGGDAPTQANFDYQVRRCIMERGRAQ